MDNEIKKYASIIWHWTWLIILGALVAGGVAYLYNSSQTPIYSASARLLIDEAPGGNGNEYSQVLLEQRLAKTYIQLIRTRPVMEEAIERLDADLSVGTLTGRVSVSVPPDTQILIITVKDTDPERAADLANIIGDVFTDQTETRENLRYAEPIANWQARLDETAQVVEAAELKLNLANEALGDELSPEDASSISLLDTRLKEAQIQYTEAFNNLNGLNVAQAKESSNLVPIEPALVPRSPISPNVRSNTILATAIGAMLAVGIIFLIEYMDDTIKTPDDVSHATGLSTIGAIAKFDHDDEKMPTRLITKNAPRDPVSEAYRVVRTNLSFSTIDDNLNSILVTSSAPSEGKSTTVANLAVVMAQTGKRVILVDSDLRRPVQHKIFGISNNRGLTTAILDTETNINDHINDCKINNLRVMTSGPIPPNPSELLSSQRMEQLLNILREHADFVIFDTPPVLTVTDSSVLATKVGGVLLVVEAGSTRRSTLAQAYELLNNSGGRVYGVLLNHLKSSRRGYYYNYYYYSHYQYEDGNRQKRLTSKKSKLPKWMQR